MKTIFDQQTQQELLQRIEKLDSGKTAQWGKMNAAQMLAHCTASMQVPVGDLVLKPTLLSLIGWMFKGMIVSEKPFQRNSPTAKEYRMNDPKHFDREMKLFQETFEKLGRGHTAIVCTRHPFFGEMTAEEWGVLLYKHLDHHLNQFGV